MIRAFLIYLPSTILPRLAAFATILAGARLLPPAEFGYFSLIMVIGEFADTAMTNWVRIALSRFGARKEGVSRDFALRLGKLALVCTLIAIAISICVTGLISPENFAVVTFAVAAYVLAVALVRFGVTLHQAMESRRSASLLECIRVLLAFTGTLGVMMGTKSFLYASLAASTVNLAMGILTVATGLRIANRDLADKTPQKVLLLFAAPLVVLALLSQAITGLDKALLKTFHDAATLGLYAAAFAVGRSGFDAIAMAFNTGAFVRLSALFNDGKIAAARELLSSQLAHLLAIALPAAGTLIASRELIARVFFPATYFEAFVTAIPLVALGAVALNLKNFVYDIVFHMHLRNFRQIPTLVVGASVSAGLGLWLLPSNAVLGAATMFAGGGVSALLMTVVLTSSLMRVKVPWSSISIAALLGLGVWTAGRGLSVLLAEMVHDLVLLGLQLAIGALATCASLAVAHVLGKPKGTKVAVSFITSTPDRVTGLSSYTESLIEAMVCRPNRPPLVFLTNARREVFSRLSSDIDIEWVKVPARPRGLPHKLYSLIIHDWACWRARVNGCRCYVSMTPAGALLPAIDQVMTLHDLYDVDSRYRPWRTIVFSHVLWRWLAMISRRIVCVSATTAGEAKLFLPFAADKMHVIKEASKFDRQVVARSRESGRFLFVANIQPVKNVECLLEALRRSSGEIWVDWVGWDMSGAVQEWISRHGAPAGFNPRGQLPEPELRDAYQNSYALIVPSWKEGFCLPVLEAHSLGIPVIASDIPILREVAGEGAIFFDAHDPDALLAAMRRLMGDPGLRHSLSATASANAQLYSWDKAAAETFQLLETV